MGSTGAAMVQGSQRTMSKFIFLNFTFLRWTNSYSKFWPVVNAKYESTPPSHEQKVN